MRNDIDWGATKGYITTMEKITVKPKKITYWREVSGLTQVELAKLVGCSRRTVQEAEAGDETSFTPLQAHLFATALNIHSVQLWKHIPEVTQFYGKPIETGEELARLVLDNTASITALSIPRDPNLSEKVIGLSEIFETWRDRFAKVPAEEAQHLIDATTGKIQDPVSAKIKNTVKICEIFDALTDPEEPEKLAAKRKFERFVFLVIERPTISNYDGDIQWDIDREVIIDSESFRGGGRTFCRPQRIYHPESYDDEHDVLRGLAMSDKLEAALLTGFDAEYNAAPMSVGFEEGEEENAK